MSKELIAQIPKEKLVEMLMAERKEKDQLANVLSEVQSKGKKASEGQLDDLQGLLARVMAEQVEYQEEVVEYTEDGLELNTGKFRYTATPALLSTIQKFLKDNSITTDISTNENTKTLEEAMKRKTKRSERLPKPDEVVELLQEG